MKPYKVSDEIDSYCGACKLTLAHSVVALLEGKPVKVRCLTCQREHKPRKAPVKRGTTVRKKKTTTTSVKLSAWQERIQSCSGEETVTDYSISKTYSVDEIILHKKFGKGFILRTPSSQKIIALFEVGEKMLLQGRPKR